MIVITVKHPSLEDTSRRFDQDRIRIGREADNDIVLASNACSRYHAEIHHQGGTYKIIDLGSTNGIKVGDRRVQELALATDTEVTLGEHTLVFSIPQEETSKTVMIDLSSAAPPGDTAAQPPPPSAPQVLHVFFEDQGQERSVKIVAGAEYVIGRSPGADIVLDDTRCSGRHAVLWWRDGELTVRDLGSANGTFVGNEKTREAALDAGDRFTVGKTSFEVSDRPRDVAEEDDLLARTQLGLRLQPATPQPSEIALDGTDGAAPSRSTGRRWVIPTVVTAVIAVAALTAIVLRLDVGRTSDVGGRQPAGDSAEPGAVIVQVDAVVRKELTFTVSAAGSVQPQLRVTVSAEVPGRVIAVPASEGSVVRRGDILVRLDDQQIRLQIDEASAAVSRDQVDLAREDFERKQRLFDDGALTRSALDQAKSRYLTLDSTYTSAEARIAQLRERLGKTRVTAPIAGTVAQTAVTVGEFVAPGAPVAVVEDATEVLISMEVSDRDVVRLRALQVVEATSDAFPGRIFQGVVERVGRSANPVTKGFEVEARIGNSEGALRSGMILSLDFQLEKRSCLVVPEAALLDDTGDRARVLVVEEGVARSVSLDLGARKDRDVEILRGLAEGDEVVIYGHEQLRDGQRVKTYRGE